MCWGGGRGRGSSYDLQKFTSDLRNERHSVRFHINMWWVTSGNLSGSLLDVRANGCGRFDLVVCNACWVKQERTKSNRVGDAWGRRAKEKPWHIVIWNKREKRWRDRKTRVRESCIGEPFGQRWVRGKWRYSVWTQAAAWGNIPTTPRAIINLPSVCWACLYSSDPTTSTIVSSCSHVY